MSKKTIKLNRRVILENGYELVNPTISYHTYGTLNADNSNVVWVCHALTANSDVMDWWAGLFGDNQLFNPDEHYIVCANILGSHYGTTSPLSLDESTGEPYYHNFPNITVRDMVQLHILLADYLGIGQIDLLIGGSIGGHQAIEWAIIQSERIVQLCSIASSAIVSPWVLALNQSQRLAIANDSSWKESSPRAGVEGMKVARSIALLSYRNQKAYNLTQSESDMDIIYPERAASYQDYQGYKLSQRFNAYSYWHLSKAMDSHNVARGRESLEKALSEITARVLLLSMEDDILFPLSDQEEIRKHLPHSEHYIVPTIYGHDGFLIETEKIALRLNEFLARKKTLICSLRN